MGLVSQSVKNLKGGISQQPDILRFSNQGKLQINGWSSESEGLQKRPPTTFVKYLRPDSAWAGKPALHLINRDRQEQYFVVFTGAGVEVVDLLGNSYEVRGYNGYADCQNPREDLRMVTVADYTFIVNRNKKVEMASSLTHAGYPALTSRAVVNVRGGQYGRTLRVIVNDVTVATVAMPDGSAAYRLGDRVADETMLRPHKMSFAPSKQYGAGWAMALQFKMFVLRSLNGRAARGWMEATKNGQALDQVMQAIVSVGLATAFYAASTHLKALGMPERARKAYLDKALNPDMLAYAAVSRSSHIGAPLGTFNFLSAPLGFDQAAMVRTSILPRDPNGKREMAVKYNPLQSDAFGDFAGRVAEQVPGAGVAANLAFGVGLNGAGLVGDSRGSNGQAYRTGLWNALRQFVPNDPVTQNLMMRLAEEQGVDRTR